MKQIKNLTRLFLGIALFGLFISISSCEKEEEDEITSLVLTLTDTNNNPVSGVVVYAYDENTWAIIGDDPLFADFQAASNSSGIATFPDLTSATRFSSLNNNTHTFRFSAHYSVNGVNRYKVTAISFVLGDDKSQTVILD